MGYEEIRIQAILPIKKQYKISKTLKMNKIIKVNKGRHSIHFNNNAKFEFRLIPDFDL